MHLRKHIGAAALVATAALAAGCSGREMPDPTDPGDPGCTGTCSTDAGTNPPSDGGTDGGSQATCPEPVNGKGPIGNLRATAGQGQQVRLENLVVVEVNNLRKGSQGDYIAQFWVVNPCFPQEGIYVDKFYTDATTSYGPAKGDVVTIAGLFRNFNPIATDADDERHAYRAVIKSAFRLPGASGNLVITKTGTTEVLPDITVPAGFGDAQGGAVQANPELAGTRVYIPGPLTLTNPNPPALKARPDDAEHTVHYGFEVSGGVLVSNSKTFGETRDGGTQRCDWRAMALDGGQVSFPQGIRGVWDTYSHVPCLDGGFAAPDGGTYSSCNFAFRDAGYVPGTDKPYTYILYPQDCANDLSGTVTAAP